jgi:hypothetical protein
MIRFCLLLIAFFLPNLAELSIAQTNTACAIHVRFVHSADGRPALFDSLVYINKAGNRYEINQVQYFVSEITLHSLAGNKIVLSSDNPVHYVDKDISKTLLWKTADSLPTGRYDSVSFIFGLSPERNISYTYKNPPESFMFWPDALGGGYHYMKINLKYLDNQGELSNFNCHLGIGRIKSKEGATAGFIHNCFYLSFPVNLTVKEDKSVEVLIIMDIGQWFDAINIMDFNNYHGIMDNQEAMRKFSENGKSVFCVKTNE